MLNISRWTSQGDSYRTIQRFFNTVLPWTTLFWVFFRTYLFDPEDDYIIAADETIKPKSGKHTYGLDRFFSSIHGKAIPSLSFLALSLVSVKERCSYPMAMEQIVRDDTSSGPTETSVSKQDAPPKATVKRPRGRPKCLWCQVSAKLTNTFRSEHTHYSVIDLKSHYRDLKYKDERIM